MCSGNSKKSTWRRIGREVMMGLEEDGDVHSDGKRKLDIVDNSIMVDMSNPDMLIKKIKS